MSKADDATNICAGHAARVARLLRNLLLFFGIPIFAARLHWVGGELIGIDHRHGFYLLHC